MGPLLSPRLVNLLRQPIALSNLDIHVCFLIPRHEVRHVERDLLVRLGYLCSSPCLMVMGSTSLAFQPVLQRIVACRHEYARLLGYASYAALAMQGTMIGSAREVEIFTDRMIDLSKRMAGAEYEVLVEAKQARHPAATTVYAWERSYWMEKVRKAHHDFDEQQLRPYLGYRQVMHGCKGDGLGYLPHCCESPFPAFCFPCICTRDRTIHPCLTDRLSYLAFSIPLLLFTPPILTQSS